MEDVRLDQLNLPVFGILSMLSVLAVRSVVYPVVLIKTRLQVQEVRTVDVDMDMDFIIST